MNKVEVRLGDFGYDLMMRKVVQLRWGKYH